MPFHIGSAGDVRDIVQIEDAQVKLEFRLETYTSAAHSQESPDSSSYTAVLGNCNVRQPHLVIAYIVIVKDLLCSCRNPLMTSRTCSGVLPSCLVALKSELEPHNTRCTLVRAVVELQLRNFPRHNGIRLWPQWRYVLPSLRSFDRRLKLVRTARHTASTVPSIAKTNQLPRSFAMLPILAGSNGLLRHKHNALRQLRRKSMCLPSRRLPRVPTSQEGGTDIFLKPQQSFSTG